MKEQIEAMLELLRGRKISKMWRIAGLQILEFGEQIPTHNRRGDQVTQADSSIHVSCPWRILHSEEIVLASWDHLDEEEKRLDDARSSTFFNKMEDGVLKVQEINATSTGDVYMDITEQYRLEILPMCSFGEEEYWRLITDILEESRQHFVVTGAGVEKSKT